MVIRNTLVLNNGLIKIQVVWVHTFVYSCLMQLNKHTSKRQRNTNISAKIIYTCMHTFIITIN